MNEAIPGFEGHPVNGTAIQMSGAIPMDDLEGAVIGVDDIVQLVCQFKCVAVHHKADKDGNLVRVQVLKPMFMIPASLDPDDPAGDFILPALPRPVQGQVSSSTSDADNDADDESGSDD